FDAGSFDASFDVDFEQPASATTPARTRLPIRMPSPDPTTGRTAGECSGCRGRNPPRSARPPHRAIHPDRHATGRPPTFDAPPLVASGPTGGVTRGAVSLT